jgi:hypothetical protein
MRAFAAAALVLTVTAPSWATTVASEEFFFHNSATPVAVPGGTTSFFMDQTAPTGSTLIVQSLAVSSQSTASFPLFTGTAIAGGGLLGPIAQTTLYLQANQQISPQCVQIDVDVVKVATNGSTSPLATGQVSTNIPQGSANGTGAVPIAMDLDVPGSRLLADGESIAATVTIHNLCNSNRTLRLVYDATSTPTRVDFLGLSLGAAQCVESIDKAMEKYVKARATYLAKCHDGVNAGKLQTADCTTEAGTLTKINKAVAKFVAALKLKCSDGLIIDGAPNGLGAAACPGLGGQCQFSFSALDDGVRGNDNDYTDCMLCMGDTATNDMIGVEYASTTAAPMSPLVELCQATIGKTGVKFEDKKLKLLQTCRKGQNLGKVVGSCPDTKTAAKIAKEVAKVGTGVASKCTDAQVASPDPAGLGLTACAGPPASCQAPIGSAADAATCVSCTHEQYVDCLFVATTGKTASGCN